MLRYNVMVLVMVLAGICCSAFAQTPHQVMASGYYARETNDRAWHIRVVGSVPSLCGAYVVVIGSEGKIVRQGVIPHGDYTEQAPFLLPIPADGVSGDYMIKIIGSQRDLLGIQVPLTDLDAEVYGGTSFTIGHEPGRRIAFKVDVGCEEVNLSAYKGHLIVRDAAGHIVGDTHGMMETPRQIKGYSNVITLPVEAGKTYWIEPESFYFGGEGKLFLTFNPDHWFQPDPQLDEVKWWRQ